MMASDTTSGTSGAEAWSPPHNSTDQLLPCKLTNQHNLLTFSMHMTKVPHNLTGHAVSQVVRSASKVSELPTITLQLHS